MEIEFNVSCLKAAKIKSDIEKELGMEQLTLWDKLGKKWYDGGNEFIEDNHVVPPRMCLRPR